MGKTTLSREEFDRLDHVIIYTVGNFDDDLAGVRGAVFVGNDGSVKGSGMFFGWAGAQACLAAN